MSQAMMKIEKKVLIDRSPDDVWSYIADPQNDASWCPKVISVNQVRGDGPGANAGYRVIHRPVRLKKPKELAVQVEEFKPPHLMRVREEDDDAVFNVTYELQPVGNGTQLTQRDVIAWKIPRFQRPIARRMVSRDIENQFSALRRLLESSE